MHIYHLEKNTKLSENTLHPRNKHQGRYDLEALIKVHPALSKHIILNAHQKETIDFSNPVAVRILNEAILKKDYNIAFWQIPEHYLCPPIPGRADYIHHIADVLASFNNGVLPPGQNIICVDIGTGANCIYPIIGTSAYDWTFIGTEIDKMALASAKRNVAANPKIADQIDIRFQRNYADILRGVLFPDEVADLCICNPPFHASLDEARAATRRKLKGLKLDKEKETRRNFGGIKSELVYKGGERKFLKDLIFQSKLLKDRYFLFSTLISKESNVKPAQELLKLHHAKWVQVVPMGQGNKKSRILVWSYLNQTDKEDWIRERWAPETD